MIYYIKIYINFTSNFYKILEIGITGILLMF